MTKIDNDIIKFLRENPLSSAPEIHKGTGIGSDATVKRALTGLLENGKINFCEGYFDLCHFEI